MSWIEEAIDRLLVKSNNEINSRIEQVGFSLPISETEALGYCYCLKLDGNGNPRVKDLVDFIADRIVDYAIPKKEIEDAQEYLNQTKSTSKIINLKKKAASLFTELKKTGEGGETLLYILTQEFLNIPQLISKMSLKTSGNVHYQGVDGIHVKYESATDSLLLYWGESKMYSNISSALTECFKSLKGFMLDPYSYASTQERDLQLISANLSHNVNDENLENLLVRYFDKDDNLSNKLKYKGVCFIGFDCTNYPAQPLSKNIEQVKKEIATQLTDWLKEAGGKIKKHTNLDRYEIHVFFIPFPSVQDFRNYFLEVLNN